MQLKEAGLGQQAQRTARRRKLGAALKELREAAGIAVAQAAAAVTGDNSKVSRIETGRHRITPAELEALLDLYRVEEKRTRDWLIALASEARKNTWWRQYGQLFPGSSESLTLESEAEKISVFQAQLVPGLLQTPEYARAVLAGAPEPRTEETLDLYVDIRMQRQRLLQRDQPPQYHCIMLEGVIRQHLGGPKTMALQLRSLAAMSRLPHVTIQVVPFTQSVHASTSGSFNLYSYAPPMDFHVVHISHLGGALFMEQDDTVRKYQRAFQALQALAMSAEHSTSLMVSIADELEQE
ncbi:helix-turn-helix domain-containing protein [Streptomyces telluris]|uniref:Helix-turn-helix domain-containing protein n=1 Tax=Streptomyces telluris TaxID=2720021 RepID=A0A9X2LG88_9ACTN|nr:helix-turn-helix transcriptional regulator [Streptomyces telluris]MCQ8770665.1 helix-turn-helix domain-containing protein [Streptomyces telluris]NJP77631.1 helix-turn-helix domain-containing protein [Streptomyces telluris]